MSSNEIKVLEKTRENLSNNSKKLCCLAPDGGGGGGTPLYGLYRYVRPQRVGFSAVLVINRVSIFAL